jgi:uncharacterized protein
MREKEVKDFKFTLTGEVTDAGKFNGYASVWGGIDSYNDTVERGAFAKTLKEHDCFPMLWSHQTLEPIGIIHGEEDKKGLLVEGDLNMDVAAAREKRALMKQGAIRGLSIGYFAIQKEFDSGGVRHLKEIALEEISPCVFPADRAARIAQIKGVPYTDFGGLLDLLNELDVKELDPRFQEAAKRAADRIYALLGKQEPPQGTPAESQPQDGKQPDYAPLFAALEKLNHTLTGGK